tara:strand:- start:755 stop:1036 length:282 start_codon:yes stop_codon:yes gene_type:complete
MVVGSITANGTTDFQTVVHGPIHVSLTGTFGSGSVALEQRDAKGNAVAIYSGGSAITATANNDLYLSLYQGDTVRLNLTGASSPDIQYKITGV